MKIKTRRYYIYYLLKTGLFLMGLIPLRVGYFLAETLGGMAPDILGKYREMAMSNLSRAMGLSREEAYMVTRKVFINLAKNGAEWIKMHSMSPSELKAMVSEFKGKEKLDEVHSRGRGVIAMGFHFGNWEILPTYLKVLGYDGKVVGRRIYFHKYDKLLNRMRARFGLGVIYRDESPKKMLKELRSGNILGIVPDQDVDSIDGVFVDFFGRPAYTPTAPAKLAMAAGIPVLPIFVVRKTDNTHMIVVEDPITPPDADRSDEAVRKFTREWSSVLEKYVRRYPEQWVWIHGRWKTRPEEEKVTEGQGSI